MTLFTTTNFPVNALIEYIDFGEIGLLELQRPFVWPNVNVRKDCNLQRFFVRGVNGTTEMHGNSVTEYAKKRFI